jgi:hypothetical protein
MPSSPARKRSSVAVFFIYYIVEYGKIAGGDTLGSYNGIKNSKLKNIHTPHIGVPKFCID